MAHFAELVGNNTVARVVVISNENIKDVNGVEQESIGVEFCRKLFGHNTKWVQTSYNGSFRGQFASVGSVYIEPLDIFIGPKPYPSWSLSDKGVWEAPVRRKTPDVGYEVYWDETDQAWYQYLIKD